MSEMVHITVNRQPLEVPAGTRVIEAAKMLNIDIPHLCYHPDQTIKAHCRPPAGEARTAPRRGLRAPAGLRRYRAPLPSRTQAQASRRDPARPRRLQAVLLPAPAWGLPSARPARLPPALTRRPTGPPSGARPAPAPQRYRPPSPGAGCRSSAAPS